jgi:hypothetical protein
MRMRRYLTILIALVPASVAIAGGGDIAGAVSPWQGARFVLWTYGAVWGVLVLYLLRLLHQFSKLKNEVSSLSSRLDTLE